MSKAEDLAGLLDANGDVLATNLDNVSVAFADLTGKPTTISGYGITDAFDGTYSSLTGAPTAVSSFTNDSGYATTTYVDGEIANLVASAPATLDTLNELAAALGDDANFSTTVTNSIATKAALSGANFTGNVTTTGSVGIGTSSPASLLDLNVDANSEQGAIIANANNGTNSSSRLRFYNNARSETAALVRFGSGHSTKANELYITNVGTTSPIAFATQDTERMRIDSSGNVGIGTASPTNSTLHVKNSASGSALKVESNTGNNYINFYDGATRTALLGTADGTTNNFYVSNEANTPMLFRTNGVERARLETDGDFHADGDVIAYSTTISDERLKTNIQGIENAVAKVSQLNGYTFEYKADGKVSAGVIAQEVEQVLPEAVSEKKLPLKTDDDQEYKVVNYDALHGLLIEAIKELSARVEALEAK